jgi:hypothetical protein
VTYLKAWRPSSHARIQAGSCKVTPARWPLPFTFFFFFLFSPLTRDPLVIPELSPGDRVIHELFSYPNEPGFSSPYVSIHSCPLLHAKLPINIPASILVRFLKKSVTRMSPDRSRRRAPTLKLPKIDNSVAAKIAHPPLPFFSTEYRSVAHKLAGVCHRLPRLQLAFMCGGSG